MLILDIMGFQGVTAMWFTGEGDETYWNMDYIPTKTITESQL